MFGLGLNSQSGPTSASRANSNNVGQSGPNKSASDGKDSLVKKYLTNCRSFYSCIYCRTHLANHDELVSRSFQGNRSRAYLFNSVINISCGPSVQRALNTGAHAVADIFCANCGKTMGWKYEKAYVESQKYKEGKYIIELAHVVRENRHLELDKRDMLLNFQQQQQQQQHYHHQQHQNTSSSLLTNSQRTNSQRASYRSVSCSSPTSGTSPKMAYQRHRWPSSSSSSNDNEPLIDDSFVMDYGLGGYGDEEEEEDEDELMFPIYDDLIHLDRSSCPSFTSSLLHNNTNNRSRRSFFHDSVPYDWKHLSSSSSSSSSRPAGSFQAAADEPAPPAGSLGSSLASPPPSSSSSSSSSAPSSPSCEAGSSNDHAEHLSAPYEVSSKLGDEETQFKFDAETDEDEDDEDDDEDDEVDADGQIGQPQDTTCDRAKCGTSVGLQQSATPLLSAGTSEESAQSSRTNSLSLDDEEFFDCCTEHHVSNVPTN